jgi:hypothetical protein
VFIANQIGSNSKIVGEQNARNNAGNFAGITQEADGNEVIFSQNGGNGILVNQSRNGASVEVRANGDVVSPAGLAITINQR